MSQVSGIVYVIVFVFSLYLSLSLYFVGQVMSPHHYDQMSQRSQVSRIVLWGCSLIVFDNVFVIHHYHCLCHCLFVGQVMSPHHYDQMSQRSQFHKSKGHSFGMFSKISLLLSLLFFTYPNVTVSQHLQKIATYSIFNVTQGTHATNKQCNQSSKKYLTYRFH